MTNKSAGSEIDMFFRVEMNKLMSTKKALESMGWRDIIYCPKDGTVFDAIEFGSTGIHACHYEGKWPIGSWWIHEDSGDLSPSRPIMFRLRSGT